MDKSDLKYSVDFNIDNYPFTFLSPYTIFQACLEKRIIIPHFCYHNKLKIAGNCRACFVEEKKSLKPSIACATSIYSGGEVFTSTELVIEARESTLEYLLINHPLDCPICDQGGECDLQDQSIIYGSDTGRFYEFKKRAVENKNYSPLIKFFLNRCIHCARCTRFSHNVSGSHLISLLGRGYNSEISSYTYKFFIDELSGNMIDLCPVGALTSKPYAFSARIWEIFDIHYLDIFDSLNSNIKLEIRGSSVVRVLPVFSEHINSEWISDKIRFNYDAYNKQRLLFCIIILNKKFYYYSWLNTFFYCKNHFFNTVLKMKKNFFKYLNFFNFKGRFISLDTSVAIKRFFYLLSSNCLSKSVLDFRNSYLPATNFYDINLDDADLLNNNTTPYNFFFFGVNTRFESPVFNLKIKEMINNFKFYNIPVLVASFGFSFNNNFYLKHLNNNLYFLINKISALGFSNLSTLYKGTFFFVFGSKMSIFDLYLKYLLRVFIDTSNSTNSVNFIHISGNSALHSLEEVGFSSLNDLSSTKRGYNSFSPTIFMNFGESHTPYLKSSTFNLNCYFGHHGAEFLKFFNLILPVKFFYEKSLCYINTEGYFQKVGFLNINYRHYYIKSEKKILDIFGKIFNINSYKLNIEKFYNISDVVPGYERFSKNNFFTRLGVYNFYIKLTFLNQFFFINVSSTINDYFLSDYVSSNSITMSLCSKKFTIFNDFVFMYFNVLFD